MACTCALRLGVPVVTYAVMCIGAASEPTTLFSKVHFEEGVLGSDAAEARGDVCVVVTTLGAAPCFDDVPPQALRRTRRRSSGRRIMRWLVYHASGGNEVGGVDPEGKGAAVPSALAAVGQRRESECARSWQHDTLSGSR